MSAQNPQVVAIAKRMKIKKLGEPLADGTPGVACGVQLAAEANR